MAQKKLNYSEVLKCLLQDQEFISLGSRLSFRSILLHLWVYF